jgi:hypothetical protein
LVFGHATGCGEDAEALGRVASRRQATAKTKNPGGRSPGMSVRFASVLAALFLAASLAGCSDGGADTDDVVVPPKGVNVAADGRDLTVSLQKNDSIDAPQWQVADWFGHHVFLSQDDVEGSHINAIVIEVGADYLLATDDQEMAKVEAAFDIPILGTIAKSDLSSNAFGVPWKMYQFPMTHGLVWQGSVSGEDFEQQIAVEFEAVYNPTIKTSAGTFPGFDIFGSTQAGIPIIQTNYVPKIGWYSEFFYFDISTEAADDWVFRSISMGFGKNWTGTYYLDSAEQLIRSDPHVVLIPDPAQPGVMVEPSPHNTFQVSESATYVFGYAYTWAFVGVSHARLEAPDGTVYEYQAVGDLNGAFKFGFLDVPAQAGQWDLVMGHAGLASGAGAHLWSIVETAGAL